MIQEHSNAKKMVSVAVGNIDRYWGVRLADGDGGVDQDGILLTINERRRNRRPHEPLVAGRHVAGGRGYAGRHEHLPPQPRVSSSCFIHLFGHVESPELVCSAIALDLEPVRRAFETLQRTWPH